MVKKFYLQSILTVATLTKVLIMTRTYVVTLTRMMTGTYTVRFPNREPCKIEVWYRGSSAGKFLYGYDMCVISHNRIQILSGQMMNIHHLQSLQKTLTMIATGRKTNLLRLLLKMKMQSTKMSFHSLEVKLQAKAKSKFLPLHLSSIKITKM